MCVALNTIKAYIIILILIYIFLDRHQTQKLLKRFSKLLNNNSIL